MLTQEDFDLLNKMETTSNNKNNTTTTTSNKNNNINDTPLNKNQTIKRQQTQQQSMDNGGRYSPKSKPRNLKSNPMSYDDYEDDDPIELELRKKMLNMLNQNSIPVNNNNQYININNNNTNTSSNNSQFSLHQYDDSDQDLIFNSDGDNSVKSNKSNKSNSNYNRNEELLYNNFNNDHMFNTSNNSGGGGGNKKQQLQQQHNRTTSVQQHTNNNSNMQQKSFLTTSNPGFVPVSVGSPKLSHNFPQQQQQPNNLNSSINNTNNLQQQQDDNNFNFNDKYLICERERIKTLSREYKFEITNERVVIKEYKLYAVEEWIFKSNHMWSAISYTGNPDDKVIVCSIRPPQQNQHSNFNTKQLYNLIVKPPNSTFYSINTRDGQLLLSNYGDSSQYGLTLIDIPDGDFDEHINDIKTNICLKRLGCTNQRYQISYMKLSNVCVDKFRRLSGFPKASQNYVNDFIKEIQAALSHLNYLPLLTKIDGMYDQKTINALKAFQIDSNNKKRESSVVPVVPVSTSPTTIKYLPTEGYLDQDTFDELQEEIEKLANKLLSFGYSPPDNPTKNYQELNQIIKQFQETYRIYPDAPGKNILNFIDKINFKIPIVQPPSVTQTQQQSRHRSKSESENSDDHIINSGNSGGSGHSSKSRSTHSRNNKPITPINNIINNNNNNIINSVDDMESFKRGQEKTDAEIFRYDDDDDEDEDDQDDDDDLDYEDVEEDEEYDDEFSNGVYEDSTDKESDGSYFEKSSSLSNNNSPTQLFKPILTNKSTANNSNNKTPIKTPTTTLINIPTITTTDSTNTTTGKNILSQTQNDINNLETITEAEEKEKLKQTILKLEGLIDKQHLQYQQLKDDFNQLYESYYDLKEKSLKSIAIISTNEKMFGEINNRWNKFTRKELPEIEDKINTNVDIIQSYSNKMKRLDDIVTSIQRKNDRNVFISFLMSIGSLLAIMFAYVLVFATKIKRKIAALAVPIANGNNNNYSKRSSSDDNIQEFVIQQKLRITQLMDDYDDVNNGNKQQ